jgi:hypothetical protein
MQNGDRQCVLYELLSFRLLRRSVVFLMMWYKLRGRRSGSGAVRSKVTYLACNFNLSITIAR